MVCHTEPGSLKRSSKSTAAASSLSQPSKPPPSNFLSKLSKLGSHDGDDEKKTGDLVRTTGFSELPAPISSQAHVKRDDRLCVVEDLEPGPYEHTPPSNDPNFQTLEPNSGIRLS
jgi:minichromosome maintenance protein 10